MSNIPPMKKNELSELFKLASLDKKKKLNEKLKIERQAKAFEEWLYSGEKKKKEIVHEYVEEIVESEPVEELIEEVAKVEPRKDLIEQSLGLLATPPDVKQGNDPLTPTNQNFATLDDLQNHYKLFLNRIQQQLSTLGGGGAVRIQDMDDVDLSTAKVNDKFLKYNSTSDKWEGADASGGSSLTTEQVQDIVGGMVSSNSETNISVTYDDTNGKLDFASTNTQLSTEQVQDIVGGMFTGNTETNITATYQDSDGTIDLVVSGGSGLSNIVC